MSFNQTEALLSLSRMMGSRVLPQGENLDWKDYVQAAFDYAWRYHKWDWSLRIATVNMTTDPYLPVDFDLGGYRQAMSDQNGELTEVKLIDYARTTATNVFALQYDPAKKQYKVLTRSTSGTIDFIYQITPPTLSADVKVDFPAVMPIGIGASIYAKQGENPTRAEVSQEWDMFHAELNRLVARVDKNQPRNTNLNLQDAYGTYTGDTR
jgi:hypothetical protein